MTQNSFLDKELLGPKALLSYLLHKLFNNNKNYYVDCKINSNILVGIKKLIYHSVGGLYPEPLTNLPGKLPV